MEYRPLGKTGLTVSAISFGAGPVAALMTGSADAGGQQDAVRRAVGLGINWFDTAATYGDGSSESSLGVALHNVDPDAKLYVATKARLMPEDLCDIAGSIRKSVEASLARLRVRRVTLLQLHNSITRSRGDLHTSITPADVLGKGGVMEAFERLRAEKLVRHIGLTGIGDRNSLREVVGSEAFETVQTPFNVLSEANGDDGADIITQCAGLGMGVFAIRIFAGGALAGQPPSAHTRKTRFFPLDLYQRDTALAAQMAALLPPDVSLKEAAVRSVLSRQEVSSALVGFSAADQIDEVDRFAAKGDLPSHLLETLGA